MRDKETNGLGSKQGAMNNIKGMALLSSNGPRNAYVFSLMTSILGFRFEFNLTKF